MTTTKLMADWIEQDAERDARRARERAEYLAEAAKPLSAGAQERLAASNKAYRAAWKVARKAGVSKADFCLNYGKTLSK